MAYVVMDPMKFVLITKDPEIVEAAKGGFHPDDNLMVFGDWAQALEACNGADMVFVDLLSTLDEPHKIAGYERFAESKMAHPLAKATPLVLISPPSDYDLDFMTGWPNFVLGHIQRPVNAKIFRRASTWV